MGLSPLKCWGAMGYWGTQGKIEGPLRQIKTGMPCEARVLWMCPKLWGQPEKEEREGMALQCIVRLFGGLGLWGERK